MLGQTCIVSSKVKCRPSRPSSQECHPVEAKFKPRRCKLADSVSARPRAALPTQDLLNSSACPVSKHIQPSKQSLVFRARANRRAGQNLLVALLADIPISEHVGKHLVWSHTWLSTARGRGWGNGLGPSNARRSLLVRDS